MHKENKPSSKKLKIAVLIRNFVITGGAERYAYHVSKRLASDHDVHIFCQTWDDTLIDEFTIHKIPRPLSRPSFVNQILFSGFCNRAIDDTFDIIYSHERVTRFDVLSIHCPCYKGFLTESHGLKKLLLWLGEVTSPRGLSYLWLEKKQYAGTAGRRLVADSRMVRDDVIGNYGLQEDYFDIAYPGVDLEEVERAVTGCDRDEVRKKLGLAKKHFALLFVGTEFKRKGLDSLLEGLSKLSGQKIRLFVAGKGDIKTYKEKARQLGILEQVSFLGKVKDIYPLYIMADAFILPTLSDPCPIAPLEAMTCGAPTIMSDIPYCGTAEHVKDNEAIILKDPRDSEEIFQAINHLLNEEARRNYSRKGQLLGQKLGWEHTTKITLDSFSKVLSFRQTK